MNANTLWSYSKIEYTTGVLLFRYTLFVSLTVTSGSNEVYLSVRRSDQWDRQGNYLFEYWYYPDLAWISGDVDQSETRRRTGNDGE